MKRIAIRKLRPTQATHGRREVAKKTKESVPVLRETMKAKRVRFQQLTAESQEKALMELFKLGVESGMIAKLPDVNFFYRGLK